MRTERTLDRRTANKLSSKRIRERCNYFFLSPTLSLSLFSPSSCLRVARREETTAKVVPFAESFRPGRLITILVKETFLLVEEEDTRREKRKEKKRRSAHAVRIHPYWILFKGDTKNSFLSISREISPVNTRDIDRICSTDRSTIRANSTNFVGVDDARSLA